MTVPVQVIGDGAAPPISDGGDDGGGPVELERGPLLRAALTGDRLVLTLPALCSDAVGLHNLVRELAASYGGRVGAGEDDDGPMQYADLAEWQNEMLEGAAADEALRWSAGDHRGQLPLSAAAGGFAPRALRQPIGPAVEERVEELARRAGVDAGAVELAAWMALLQTRRWPGRAGGRGRVGGPQLRGARRRTRLVRAGRCRSSSPWIHRRRSRRWSLRSVARSAVCRSGRSTSPGDGGSDRYFDTCFAREARAAAGRRWRRGVRGGGAACVLRAVRRAAGGGDGRRRRLRRAAVRRCAVHRGRRCALARALPDLARGRRRASGGAGRRARDPHRAAPPPGGVRLERQPGCRGDGDRARAHRAAGRRARRRRRRDLR